MGYWNKNVDIYNSVVDKSSAFVIYLKHNVVCLEKLSDKSVDGSLGEGEKNSSHEGDEETETKELPMKDNLLDMSITFFAGFR